MQRLGTHVVRGHAPSARGARRNCHGRRLRGPVFGRRELARGAVPTYGHVKVPT